MSSAVGGILLPDDPLYVFSQPPSAEDCEWPGSAIGISNTITRTKGRTALHNKTLDATPGLYEKLLKSAHDHLDRVTGRHAVFAHDVVIHGIRVRATTNSLHLHDFWVDNWYGLEEWERLTGQAPPSAPHIHVYALTGVKSEEQAAYYSRHHNTIIFFNTSYYGQLKSWVLGAVGRILAAEWGIHSIHGSCVEKAGSGVLYIAPTGTGKSTSSYGLMTHPKTRFHSDDWVYVRYTYLTRDNRRVFILRADGFDGTQARGYQIYRWIEQHAQDSQARLMAMTLDNHEVSLTLSDLDLSKPIAAYAYTSEKVFYLRTNLVESFPASVGEILSSKEENVPEITPTFLECHRPMLQPLTEEVGSTRDAKLRDILRGKSEAEIERTVGRLIAFDNARSMLDIGNVLPADRVFANPMEPTCLAAVMLLKRSPEDPSVLTDLSLDRFMERLLIGETPEKKRETAYNAYRAVDDNAERSLIDELEKQQKQSGAGLYQLYSQAAHRPASLEEELELFRMMFKSVRTYDLNTILQKDPKVGDKREAVRRTIDVIARTVEERPQDIHLTLENYGQFIS